MCDPQPTGTVIKPDTTYYLTSHSDGRVEIYEMPVWGCNSAPIEPVQPNVKHIEHSFRAKGHSPQNAAMMARLKAARTKKR